MLVSLGHGQRVLKVDQLTFNGPGPGLGVSPPPPTPDQAALTTVATAGAAGAGTGEGRFGYLFPRAAGPSHPIDSATLDLLGDAMIEQAPRPEVRAIAPIFTYFGQFIDHDITANTDRNITGSSNLLTIDKPNIAPLPRDLVVAAVTNLRNATLGLDSLYGDGPQVFAIEKKLRDGAKMRIGIVDLNPNIPGQHPHPPADNGADLPRVGPLVQAGVLNAAEVPSQLLTGGVASESRAALIGDSRNEENLIVAQIHLAFLRFHNAVVDAKGGPNDEAAFKAAQAFVRRTYQWLVINAYLPAVCDKATLDKVIAKSAPLYQAFYDVRKSGLKPGELPIPLEFSVAAFRYGHSLIRARYDFNVNFTGPNAATFNQLFEFTGRNPNQPIGGFGFPTLPFNWIIDWSRFLGRPTDGDVRFARAIDTALAPPLADMVNEQAGIFRNLARRNLRRGWLMNLPTAQNVATAMDDAGHALPRVLTADEIVSGAIAGSALSSEMKAEFGLETPLWFYILKEAEVINKGERLGPLGTRIVAETLVGLAINDAESYWHAGAGGKRWAPSDEVLFAGPVDSLESFLKAAGVL